MTRLDYMRMTGGQRRDVAEHLRAMGGKLSDLTFDHFGAPFVAGRWVNDRGYDGNVRSQNHHGKSVEDLCCRAGFVISTAKSGAVRQTDWSSKPDKWLQNLFKPRLHAGGKSRWSGEQNEQETATKGI